MPLGSAGLSACGQVGTIEFLYPPLTDSQFGSYLSCCDPMFTYSRQKVTDILFTLTSRQLLIVFFIRLSYHTAAIPSRGRNASIGPARERLRRHGSDELSMPILTSPPVRSPRYRTALLP
jgi:hypothetical protein